MDVPWRLVRSLGSKKEREERGLTVVEGYPSVITCLDAGVKVEFLFVSESFSQSEKNVELLRAATRHGGVQAITVSDEIFRKMSHTENPQGVLCVVPMPFEYLGRKPSPFWPQPLYVAGVDIQDPGNIGVIIRNSAAAGATRVILAGECADPFSPKCIRASAGAVFVVPVETVEDIGSEIAKLSSEGVLVYRTSPRGGDLPWEVPLDEPCALLFGNEARGLPPVLATGREVSIPMPGGTESLNVAAASAILLYEAVRQRSMPGLRTV